jgi:hypothetical protein
VKSEGVAMSADISAVGGGNGVNHEGEPSETVVSFSSGMRLLTLWCSWNQD